MQALDCNWYAQAFCLLSTGLYPDPKHMSQACVSEHPFNNILHLLQTQNILFCNFRMGGSNVSLSGTVFGYRQWYIWAGATNLKHVTCWLNFTRLTVWWGFKCFTMLQICRVLILDKIPFLADGVFFINVRTRWISNSKLLGLSFCVISSKLLTVARLSSWDT